MENNQKLIDWALANAEKLFLKVTRLTGINEWLPGHFDYHVSMSVAGAEVFGRGTDTEESRAFLKAVAEAVERAACQGLEYPWATSTHTDRQEASLRAYRELLGMDRALCHHFTGTKVRTLGLAVLNDKALVNFLDAACKKHAVTICLCEMRPSVDSYVAVAYAWMSGSNNPPGVLSGYGCAGTLPEAGRQAIVECVRKIGPIFIERNKPREEMAELEKLRSPWWHVWKMSQEPAGRAYLKNVLIPAAGENVLFTREELLMKDVRFREISGFKELFPDVPCVVMQAYSDKLILPQFGKTIIDDITLTRLRLFCGKNGCLKTETVIPHLYG